jgi:hypothetical protein
MANTNIIRQWSLYLNHNGEERFKLLDSGKPVTDWREGNVPL